jgi:hypothetical protein
MRFSLRTYTAYSIACAVVWAAILIVYPPPRQRGQQAQSS